MGSTTLVLLRTVFESILQVFFICFAGWTVARQGILDKKTQKQINRLNVSLFTPALLFSKVAFFLTPDKIRELWMIPIIFVIVTLVSGLVAWAFACVWRLKRSQRAFAIAASMFMNSNALPIALMQSMVVTVQGLEWGPDDTRDGMLGRALTYLVLYSTLGLMLRWSYGVHLLAQADDEVTPDTTEPLILPATSEDEERSPLLGSFTNPPPKNYSSATLRSEGPTPSITFGDEDEDVPIHVNPLRHQYYHPPDTSVQPQGTVSSQGPLVPPRPIRRRSHFFYSFPNTPRKSRVSLSPDSDPEPGPANIGAWEKIKAGMHTVYEFMTPPMWAALASIVVACIRPMQHMLEAHLSPVRGALTAAGNCSIPLTLIVLGGYFNAGNDGVDLPQFRPRDHDEDATPRLGEDDHEGLRRLERPTSEATLVGTWSRAWKGLRTKVARTTPRTPPRTLNMRKGETATVFVAVMSRMFITPLLLMPVCVLLTKYATHDVFEDPVFILSNVLVISSPPALTLAQITQAASGDAFERLLSRTIFWSYCILTPFTTIFYVVLGLWLTRL